MLSGESTCAAAGLFLHGAPLSPPETSRLVIPAATHKRQQGTAGSNGQCTRGLQRSAHRLIEGRIGGVAGR